MLATVVFLGSFAWSFVYVELPFYAGRLTTYDVGPTLAWTGWILGITSLVSVVSTPVWGRYSDQHDPRGILVGMHLFQAIGFLGAAVVRSLPALFLVRCALGAVGASATVAFLLAGRIPDPAERRRRLAGIQSANTLGSVVGPLGPCRALQTNMLSEGPDAHAAKPSVSKVRRSSRWRF